MKQFLKNTKNLTLTAILALGLGGLTVNNAKSETINDILNNTNPVNITDSITAHGAEVFGSWYKPSTMTSYVATNATPGVMVIKNQGSGQMNEPYAIVMGENISPALKAEIIAGEGIEYKAIDVEADSNLTEAWTTIDNALFGNPTTPSFDYAFHGPIREGVSIKAYDPLQPSTPLEVFIDNANNAYYIMDSISRDSDTASFFFEVRDNSGQFVDLDTTISVPKGVNYLNLIQDGFNIPDSIHNIVVYTTPGATIDIAGVGTLIADGNGEADTTLTDTANLSLDFTISLDEFYTQDSTIVTQAGANNVLNMSLTSWPQFVLEGNTNTTLIELLHSVTSQNVDTISDSNGEINTANQSYLSIFKHPDNPLVVNAYGSNPALTNTVTDTWVLAEGINSNDLMIDSTGLVFHYQLTGYATANANYIMTDDFDTTDVKQIFQAGSTLLFPGDSLTTNYNVTFDHDASSIDLRVKGNRSGCFDLDSVYTVYEGQLTNADIRLDAMPVGIEENEQEKGNYNAYPVPFDKKLTVKYTDDALDNSQLKLLDITGREIESQYTIDPWNNTISIDTKELSPGAYILQSTTDDGQKTYSHKVLKQ